MEIDPAAALSALASAVTGLLADVAFARVFVAPERIAPVGLGGFIRYSVDPRAEIAGVRVSGVVQVAVRAASRDELDEAAKDVIGALSGRSRALLVSAGIQRLEFAELGGTVAFDAETLEREINFKVQFEHQNVPSAADGVIEQIPIELETESP